MSKTIEGLYYSQSHEWVKAEGNIALIGITDYAQEAMPQEDDTVDAEQDFGAVESVKAASDLISPVSGTVREVNTALEDSPALLNTAPYENWIIKVEMSDPSQLDNLMSAADYAAYCETL